jgi:hypothetical protein
MKTFVVLSFSILAAMGSTTLYAQVIGGGVHGSRLEKRVGDSWLGMNDPGNFGTSSTFKEYSNVFAGTKYGAPTVNVLGTPNSGTSILGAGSSMSSNLSPLNGANFGGLEGNRGGGPTMPGLIPSSAGGGDFLYRGLSSNLQDVTGEGAVGALLRRRSSLWLSQDYNHADHRLDSAKEDREPIKSLVPVGGGLYHDYLESGEKAFRSGDYTVAFSKFRMANYIGLKDPESLLSMSQAQFGGKCYPLAAYYLRQAMKYMPRLPMLPLRPKAFYGDPSVYVQNIQDLDEYLVGHPQDTDALLLRAYYAWFDVDEADSVSIARNSLQKALAGNNTPDVTLAIEAFWEGMVASGKAKGPLVKPQPDLVKILGDKKS